MPTVEVSSIIMENGKVLIGRSAEGLWEVPTVEVMPFEGIKDAGMRGVFMNAGITVEPQNVLFVSESIKKETHEHRIVIYLYAKFIKGELKPDNSWSEAVWVDVRELAKYQEAMSDLTADGFYKFSLVLRQSAGRSGAQA
jgi:ADP-ribose pyrophosphatase YjhB (NUDIX family)